MGCAPSTVIVLPTHSICCWKGKAFPCSVAALCDLLDLPESFNWMFSAKKVSHPGGVDEGMRRSCDGVCQRHDFSDNCFFCRLILHGKELEDKSLLTECGLDDEAPIVHLVMRLPATGTARRKREPMVAAKDVGGMSSSGVKVKVEPGEDDDLAAMSFAGIRQLSDMLVDGDQMEFEQVCF